jgi:hypothetical protein
MLVITRKKGESVRVGDVTVRYLDHGRGHYHLMIEGDYIEQSVLLAMGEHHLMVGGALVVGKESRPERLRLGLDFAQCVEIKREGVGDE